MFGMLDYRAHNLYWLLNQPLSLLIRITNFGLIFVSILLAKNYIENPAIQFIVAIFLLELLGTFLLLIAQLFIWIGNKIFFFFIDVVPADGRDKEDSLIVLNIGRKNFQALKKYVYPRDICYDDIDEMFNTFPIVTRLLFGDEIREHIKAIVHRLQTYVDQHNIENLEREMANFAQNPYFLYEISSEALKQRSILFRFWMNPMIYAYSIKYIIFVAIFVSLHLK